MEESRQPAHRFEDLEVWQEAMRVAVDIYRLLQSCRDFGLKDQMQRAAVSIPSNIAEGYDRQGNKEFIHFLHIAKGSCAELRTQLYLAMKLDLIARESADDLISRTKRISGMLTNLIKYRKNKQK